MWMHCIFQFDLELEEREDFLKIDWREIPNFRTIIDLSSYPATFSSAVRYTCKLELTSFIERERWREREREGERGRERERE